MLFAVECVNSIDIKTSHFYCQVKQKRRINNVPTQHQVELKIAREIERIQCCEMTAMLKRIKGFRGMKTIGS